MRVACSASAARTRRSGHEAGGGRAEGGQRRGRRRPAGRQSVRGGGRRWQQQRRQWRRTRVLAHPDEEGGGDGVGLHLQLGQHERTAHRVLQPRVAPIRRRPVAALVGDLNGEAEALDLVRLEEGRRDALECVLSSGVRRGAVTSGGRQGGWRACGHEHGVGWVRARRHLVGLHLLELRIEETPAVGGGEIHERRVAPHGNV